MNELNETRCAKPNHISLADVIEHIGIHDKTIHELIDDLQAERKKAREHIIQIESQIEAAEYDAIRLKRAHEVLTSDRTNDSSAIAVDWDEPTTLPWH